MTVFYNNGRGDIYGGPTKEAILAAMREDMEMDWDESEMCEVKGSMKICVMDENEEVTDEMVTLDEEYVEGLGAYQIASENY